MPRSATPRAPFPSPEPAIQTLRSTPAGDALIATADRILTHCFPLLGTEVKTGPTIRWRRDYLNEKETAAVYFRRIPYLDAAVAGDHKMIWELNRHQHLVLLAQAYRLTEQRPYLQEIADELDSWFHENPMQRGINWTSALEVAFRSLSWMWIDHLVGPSLSPAVRARLTNGLYQHAAHLESNLSVYFSPNTHLLGEAVALHALGVMFRGSAPARKWESLGARIVLEEMQRQVRADGSHFEQSSYYHVYALDMFLFHAILAEPPEWYLCSVERMAIYLEALMGPARSLPFLGDDDGGRFFHPFGPRARFGAATLAACGRFFRRPEWIGDDQDQNDLALWWFGPQAHPPLSRPARARPLSLRFPDAGVVVLSSDVAHCILDVGPFGPFRGGHSHADTLSLVASSNGQELLIDPGTFSYSANSPWRNRFRGTAAHNTVRIGGMDQAEAAGAFGWRNPPLADVQEWHSDNQADFIDAVCRYRGFQHRRRLYFRKPDLIFILDDLEGDEIDAEQFWHPGLPAELCGPGCFRIGDAGILLLDQAGQLAPESEFAWRSQAYGTKEPAPLIVSRRSGKRAVQFGAVVAFSNTLPALTLLVRPAVGNTRMILSGGEELAVDFPGSGMPRCGLNR